MEVRAKAVQRATAHQRIKGTLVDPFEVDAFTEIEQVLEGTALGTGLDNRLHRAFADTLMAPRP